MIGRLLSERYRIDRRIGKGAFGEVYRAHDTRLKRDVAVKVLTSPGHDDGFKVRFLRESESMARLMHPHIVTVFDFGEHESSPFMVMEFVEGISLLEVMDKANPEMGEILNYGVQIAQALECAHTNGIVHRDLTLRNIMLNVSGEIKVLDFGLAKLVNAEVQSDPGILVGTPMYLSPEQTRGEQVDARADIFSFGVCMYRMLCGRYPFEAEHPAAILYLIANENPQPPDEAIPADVGDIIMKCLEKDRANRYATFAEIQAALDEAIRGNVDSLAYSSASGPTAVRERAFRTSKRNPFLNRIMIKSPDDFYGREREVNRIFSRLDAPHPQSISIVGERRAGKSSLLNYVYHRRNRLRFMQHHRDAIFVYMDFQRGGDMDVPKFINILFEMFDYEQKTGFAGTRGELNLDMLRDAVEKIDSLGKRVIVLMDEFDAITTNPRFEMQFFSFLRFLANNYKVAYVTSSMSDLQQMCHDKEIADSPFFNIFSNLPLRPFSPEEVQELITVPSQREGVPLEPYVDQIIEMSGYFPFYVQICCSSVFESIIESDGGVPDWDQVRKTFTDEALPHFTFVWDRMDESVRENMVRVAAGKQINKKFQHLNEDLHRLGYLRKSDDGESVIFSGPFKEFVQKNSTGRGGRRSFLGGMFKRDR